MRHALAYISYLKKLYLSNLRGHSLTNINSLVTYTDVKLFNKNQWKYCIWYYWPKHTLLLTYINTLGGPPFHGPPSCEAPLQPTIYLRFMVLIVLVFFIGSSFKVKISHLFGGNLTSLNYLWYECKIGFLFSKKRKAVVSFTKDILNKGLLYILEAGLKN